MRVAAALGQSERVAETRSYVANGLSATADISANDWSRRWRRGHVTRTLSAKVRGRALIDLIQGLLLRAKVGGAREELLEDARSYVSPVLGT
jgi:hypothetical protein